MATISASANGSESMVFVPTVPIIFQPPFGGTWPWPTPLPPIFGERSEADGAPFGQGDILEVLEAVYLRPDVQSLVAANAKNLAELMSRDDEATQGLRDFVQELTPDSEERIPLALAYGGCILVGAILGYLSRP